MARANHPLSSHPKLGAAFEDLRDGCEVVPSALAVEYRRRLDEEPLAAALLRVPISTGQRHKLRRAGRLRGEEPPP
jgi:plasmid stabilization system protein ParE